MIEWSTLQVNVAYIFKMNKQFEVLKAGFL